MLVLLLCRYTSWLCRGMVSATTFTLVGVVNKFLTLLLNVVVWEKHSTPLGMIAVSVCLLAGTFYQQAPRRASPASVEDNVEKELLLPTIIPALTATNGTATTR